MVKLNSIFKLENPMKMVQLYHI